MNEVKVYPASTPDLDSAIHLIAGVFRTALKDALRGDAKAIEWLDVTAPDWREKVPQMRRRSRRKTGVF